MEERRIGERPHLAPTGCAPQDHRSTVDPGHREERPGGVPAQAAVADQFTRATQVFGPDPHVHPVGGRGLVHPGGNAGHRGHEGFGGGPGQHQPTPGSGPADDRLRLGLVDPVRVGDHHHIAVGQVGRGGLAPQSHHLGTVVGRQGRQGLQAVSPGTERGGHRTARVTPHDGLHPAQAHVDAEDQRHQRHGDPLPLPETGPPPRQTGVLRVGGHLLGVRHDAHRRAPTPRTSDHPARAAAESSGVATRSP